MGLFKRFETPNCGGRSPVSVNPDEVARVEGHSPGKATIVTRDKQRITVFGSVDGVTEQLNARGRSKGDDER